MAISFKAAARRLFTTPYCPDPQITSFQTRAQTQEDASAKVTAAVLDAAESERRFGVPLARRGLQPVFLRIENRSQSHLRLQIVGIDPNYFTPLEAAGVNHFSIVKRLSTFGFLWWLAPLLLPLIILSLLIIIPFKLITAYRANRRMDECFQSQAFRLRPIPPGGSSEGFVFTQLDSGTKVVHISLHATGGSLQGVAERVAAINAAVDAGQPAPAHEAKAAEKPSVEFTFSIPVPGIAVDYHRRNFTALLSAESTTDCNLPQLVEHLRNMPTATTNLKAAGTGDPVNLVVIGEFETIIGAFAARWDETETITLKTCWKTTRAFLLGSQYRYSPVSALYLFGRSQDVALQRSRRSINERLHLRLWLTPMRFSDKPVWVGQVSRDIGVRFTTKVWNLTTHRIDPDVDESRDYVVEDLLEAERVEAVGYLDGVGVCDWNKPRHNLTGDPYFTDGKRAVILLSTTRIPPRFVAWS